MKVLMIGGGNMGKPFAEGMSKSSFFKEEKLWIFDRNPEKLEEYNASEQLKPVSSLEESLPHADIVFLAVKPHQIDELFTTMKPLIKEDQVFVSIMAGVKIETIIEGLGVEKVIRTMPNLPAKIGRGVTAHTESHGVSPEELNFVRDLIEMTGSAIHVSDERMVDASTSISGSGPAYVFYFMQSLVEAAMDLGFSEEDAKTLVSDTFQGAVELFNQSSISLENWIDQVTSKGGTTEAALKYMESKQLKELIKSAAEAAFNRAVELGKKS